MKHNKKQITNLTRIKTRHKKREEIIEVIQQQYHSLKRHAETSNQKFTKFKSSQFDQINHFSYFC